MKPMLLKNDMFEGFDVETKRDMDSTCTTSLIAFFYFTWAELYIGADQRACKNGSPLRHLHRS